METPVIDVARAIQQAVAPVFLLTGVGAFLSVLSSRLGRVIDRFRALECMSEPQLEEMETLAKRARWIHWAISLCTVCALFVCIVIAALFVGSELNRDPSETVASFFVAAMAALIFGLLCFLREIALATGIVRPR